MRRRIRISSIVLCGLHETCLRNGVDCKHYEIWHFRSYGWNLILNLSIISTDHQIDIGILNELNSWWQDWNWLVPNFFKDERPESTNWMNEWFLRFAWKLVLRLKYADIRHCMVWTNSYLFMWNSKVEHKISYDYMFIPAIVCICFLIII